MFKNLGNVLLFVADLERSVSFYQEKLDLTIRTREEGYVEFDLEGTALSVVEAGEAAKMINAESIRVAREGGQTSYIAVAVSDVDGAYSDLQAKGVTFIKAPFTQPWGQKTAYFEDPDGHIWEVHD